VGRESPLQDIVPGSLQILAALKTAVSMMTTSIFLCFAASIASFANGRSAVYQGLSKGAMKWSREKGMTTFATRAFMSMRRRNEEFRQNPSEWEYEDEAYQGQANFFGAVRRQQSLMKSVQRGRRKMPKRLSRGGTSPTGGDRKRSSVGEKEE
jgi:hypothetical protein